MFISVVDRHHHDQSLDFIDRTTYRDLMSQLTLPSTPLTATLDDLAWAIARDGIERHEPAVARAVAALRAAGTASLFLDVVADRREPAVARERAFGRIGPRPAHTGHTDPRRIAA
jgi:hypothetical protein